MGSLKVYYGREKQNVFDTEIGRVRRKTAPFCYKDILDTASYCHYVYAA